eukprot:gene23915-58282_t
MRAARRRPPRAAAPSPLLQHALRALLPPQLPGPGLGGRRGSPAPPPCRADKGCRLMGDVRVGVREHSTRDTLGFCENDAPGGSGAANRS